MSVSRYNRGYALYADPLATPESDLNGIVIPDIDGGDDLMFFDNRGVKAPAEVEVVFRDIEDRLLKFINDGEVIVGCVAWLTNYNILRALGTKEVSIIVQKEDFLRPDKMSNQQLKVLYDNLSNDFSRYDFDLLDGMSYCGDPSIEPIRCAGNHNRDKNPSFPRMHNKFIVSCRKETVVEKRDEYEFERDRIIPQAVWTGSFNFSYNAGRSLENGVILYGEDVARAYLKEYALIAAISEPLDWESEWCTPEWRLGS